MNKLYFQVLEENKFVCRMLKDYIKGNNKFPSEVMPLVKEIDKITEQISDATHFTSLALQFTGEKTLESLMLYLETFGPETVKMNFKMNRLGKILREKHGF